MKSKVSSEELTGLSIILIRRGLVKVKLRVTLGSPTGNTHCSRPYQGKSC